MPLTLKHWCRVLVVALFFHQAFLSTKLAVKLHSKIQQKTTQSQWLMAALEISPNL
jgi:hypothetical protein